MKHNSILSLAHQATRVAVLLLALAALLGQATPARAQSPDSIDRDVSPDFAATCYQQKGTFKYDNPDTPTDENMTLKKYEEINCADLQSVDGGKDYQAATACYELVTTSEGGRQAKTVLVANCNEIRFLRALEQNNGATEEDPDGGGGGGSETTPKSPRNFGNLESNDLPVQDQPFFKDYLIPIVNILSGGVVALAAVFMVVAGVQYSTGRDNPQMVAAAKARIVNVLIGLLAYLFIYGFLQWIIPGGAL